MTVTDADLDAYALALDGLLGAPTPELRSRVLTTLLARDRIASRLTGVGLSPQELARLGGLDRRLRALASDIASTMSVEALEDWRTSRSPNPAAWWWSLDEVAAFAAPRPSPLWALLAGFLLTVSISLTADISRRFLAGGADFAGVFSTVAQAFLTLVAGSAFLQAGSGWVGQVLDRLSVPRAHRHRWKTGAALALLLIVLAFRLSLPVLSRLYNDQGVRRQVSGELTSAISSYRRAISLSPDVALSHYNLGAALESVLSFDEAQREYQTAIQADSRLYLAYNNLARLYIVRLNDPASALSILDQALQIPNDDPSVLYSLYKNRAWSYLELDLDRLAEADARLALELHPGGAAAYCLQAFAQERKGEVVGARDSWEQCVALAAPGESVEAIWHATAREKLESQP